MNICLLLKGGGGKEKGGKTRERDGKEERNERGNGGSEKEV